MKKGHARILAEKKKAHSEKGLGDRLQVAVRIRPFISFYYLFFSRIEKTKS